MNSAAAAAADPIVSTRDHPGEYDALVSAKPDEPIFVIQGGDPFGPATVLYWAGLARGAGLAEENKDKADALLRKATNAEQVAWRMQAYQKGDQEPTGGRARYNDAPPVPVAEDADERAVRIRVANRCANMHGEAIGLVEQLRIAGHDGAGTATLRNAVEELGYAAQLIEPRTGREQS